MKTLHKTDRLITSLTQADLRQIIAQCETAIRAIESVELSERSGEISRRVIRDWTYILQHTNCGKGSCKRCGGKSYTHGPYWYAYKRLDGKLTSLYIGSKLKPVDTEDGYDDTKSLDRK